ncbi:MAG TPA: hypothetical protein VK427_02495 [Kofleriaceae bacterium]|nr:hypothetical protein [Kofleriaceae bacterium]
MLTLLASTVVARAEPDWRDGSALVVTVTAAVAPAVRACTKVPADIGLLVTRTRAGTRVAMPMPPVGKRGLTAEERCLMKAIATITLPPLPAEVDRLLLAHTFVAEGAPPVTKDWSVWRDLPAVLATLDRSALARCSDRPLTVRVILDVRSRTTRAWLPAWQFHAADGSGTTPPPQARVKACLTKVIARWEHPAIPSAIGEIQLALATTP